MDNFLAQLFHRFFLRDLGNLNYFMGVEVVTTSSGLFLFQHKYIRDLLAKFDMLHAKEVITPMASSTQLNFKMELVHPMLLPTDS